MSNVKCLLHSNEPQVSPNLLEQIVEIPLVMSRNGNSMRNLVNDVQLLDRNLIDLVETVDARNVDSIAFDDVYQVVDGGVASHYDIGVVDSVFA